MCCVRGNKGWKGVSGCQAWLCDQRPLTFWVSLLTAQREGRYYSSQLPSQVLLVLTTRLPGA